MAIVYLQQFYYLCLIKTQVETTNRKLSVERSVQRCVYILTNQSNGFDVYL